MPLSPEDRTKYGCWLCRKYKLDDSLPPQSSSCFPCTFKGIQKGPYDPPCEEGGFKLHKSRLKRAQKEIGEVVLNRLEIRNQAYLIRMSKKIPDYKSKREETKPKAKDNSKLFPRGKPAERHHWSPYNFDNLPMLPEDLRVTAFRCILHSGFPPNQYVRLRKVRFPEGAAERLVDIGFLRMFASSKSLYLKAPYTKLAEAYLEGSITEDEVAKYLGLPGNEDVA